MTCAFGFDPFGERNDGLQRHARGCPECAKVLRVLGTCSEVWQEAAVSDEARAVFRERRLWRAKRPARTALMSALVFVAVGVATAWAFERFAEREREPAPLAPPSATAASAPSVVPDLAPSARAAKAPPPSVTVSAARPTSRVGADDPWELALACLDRGDREGAARMFRRVIDAKGTDPRLRRRAMFRWAEVLLAMGDTVTPTGTLWQLVRGDDTTLGFDSALLLERCSPDDRARIWDAYLESSPGEPLRTQAIERRDRE